MPSLRPRRLSLALAALPSALACSDASGPTARSSLAFAPVEAVAGEIRPVAGDPSHREFRCRFFVEPTVVGERPIRLVRGSVELTVVNGGEGPRTSITQFSASEISRWFGGRDLSPGGQRGFWLETWTYVHADIDLVGAAGAHRARWVFTYDDDEATVLETSCVPATTSLMITLRDSITRLDVTGAPVQFGTRELTTNGWGQVILHEVVLGRHRLRVNTGRHAILDTILTLPDPTTHGSTFGLLLRRTSPGLHAFRFCPSMALGGLCEPEIELSDPAGAARLPDSLRVSETNEGTSPPHRYEMWSARVDTLDATRRRYTFPTTNNLATRVRFEAANDAGMRAAYECERPDTQFPGFVCREVY